MSSPTHQSEEPSVDNNYYLGDVSSPELFLDPSKVIFSILEYDTIVAELKSNIGFLKRAVRRTPNYLKDIIIYNRVIVLSNIINIDELIRVFKRELGDNYQLLDEAVRRGYDYRRQEYKSFQNNELF